MANTPEPRAPRADDDGDMMTHTTTPDAPAVTTPAGWALWSIQRELGRAHALREETIAALARFEWMIPPTRIEELARLNADAAAYGKAARTAQNLLDPLFTDNPSTPETAVAAMHKMAEKELVEISIGQSNSGVAADHEHFTRLAWSNIFHITTPE